MKTSKLFLGVVLFSILGVLFLYMAGFFTEKLPEQRIVKLSDLQGAKVHVLEEQMIPLKTSYTGTVVADQKATVSARLTAKVAEVLVDVGDMVKQGDVLMRLESRDLDARVKQTEQSLSSAQARLNAARKEYKRVKELVLKKLLSQSEFDRAESELRTAQANFRQAEATVVEAETTYGFSVITAPFDGQVTQRPVNLGDTATPGMELLRMYNPATLQLETSISESQIKNVRLGTELEYSIPTHSLNGKGKVVEISPAADANSRSFIVKLSMDSDQTIYPGSYGKVTLTAGEVSGVILPGDAIYQVGQLDYVKIVEDDQVKRRLVQLGKNNIVRKGVSAGDKLLLNPLTY
ncbi:efflux RND transporter periplasmic adaptor subunit [Vibrio sp. JC009]|uniref:efflux RND transporter periplasmic adaptor subunit n=1 Tax=Vibrio sp. JC009 TaxID=2912314 RepID=UPI0023B0D7D6|nr:efflux RND transporter periplasmic adaptor subunit [Vibrio sp. JC009]WED24407.1 efflux RND transporter periplasmic adaptor subunit [Vibrio sp. JC009]